MRTRVLTMFSLLAIGSAAALMGILPAAAAVRPPQPAMASASLGDAAYHGSMGGKHLNAPVVGMAATMSGGGYWLAASDGGVFNFGDAPFYGSLAGATNIRPIVGIAADPITSGFWLVGSDGSVHPFGGAIWYHDMANQHLNQPMVGMAATADGLGYWLVSADGGVFAFGDASFSGSYVGLLTPADRSVVAVSAFSDNQHYLLATAAGAVSVFGFTGGGSWPGGFYSANAPMTAAANWGTGDNPGWWTAGADGGVFALGSAPFYGSMGGTHLNAPVVSIAATPTHHGYWLVSADGGVFTF